MAKTSSKLEWREVKGVLAKVIENPTRVRLEVLEGQGSLGKFMIAGDRTDRAGLKHDQIVVVDVMVSDSVSFYRMDGKTTYFADNESDPKVAEYKKTHDYGPTAGGTASSEPEAAPEPERKVDPTLVEKFKLVAPVIPKNTIVMEKAKWAAICGAVQLDQYPIVLGPKGCGKTLTAKAVAESLGMEFHAFNLGQAFKPKKFFVGGLGANEQGTYFIPSEFYNAFCSDKPTLIFLDEITRTPAQAANFIMTITDRKQSYIYNEDEGKRIHRGANVRFMAAGNMGMEYVDTRTMDGAFKDRFTPFHLDYMTEKQEVKFLSEKFPVANPTEITKLVKCANIVRKACEAGSISQAISTRKLEDLTAYLQGGFTFDVVNEMFLSIFVNGNIDERSEVRSLLQSKV